MLVFRPDSEDFFLSDHVESPPALHAAAALGRPDQATLVGPRRRRKATGTAIGVLDGVAALSSLSKLDLDDVPGSVAVWSIASKQALDLVARERFVPVVRPVANARSDPEGSASDFEARWAAAPSRPGDTDRLALLARSMPPAAHAVPAGLGRRVWAPEALLAAFLDATVDAFVRASIEGPAALSPPRRRARSKRSGDDLTTPWAERFRAGLSDPHRAPFAVREAEVQLARAVARWRDVAAPPADCLRPCLRLEMPTPAAPDDFTLRFLLQAPDDPSLLIDGAEVWSAPAGRLARLGRAFEDPQETLLEALGRAARSFPSVARALAEPAPEAVALDAFEAWSFTTQGAPALAEAGFGIILPAELTAAGQRRLRLRLRIGGRSVAKTGGAVAGASGVSLAQLVDVDWEAALGDATISERTLRALARRKVPLVQHRGEWVVVDPDELAAVQQQLDRGDRRLSTGQALVSALTGELEHEGQTVEVRAEGAFGELVQLLRQGPPAPADPPATLQGTLRPYQRRGLAWLSGMASFGLGACLADDMGLGKSIQLLAFLLQRKAQQPDDTRPSLLVVPTSVLGNWQREAARFASSLRVVPHYGPDRAKSAAKLRRARGALILTSYGLLRRDRQLLAQVRWSTVALDEAQNIKNPSSATARAAFALLAEFRFALTGTPIENRLAELWSIFEFCNPGLLGPLERFRKRFAIPIERYGNEAMAAQLERLASPFVLRRLKSDPKIISDLPPKHEMRVVCTLTREQASLYQAVVDDEMGWVESATTKAERRGRVLRLLTHLKQVCNHPAQYLGEAGPLPRRSGKLDRLTEMLEEALAEGDKALVFTQYREMGERLVRHVRQRLGVEVVFLHGGTPRKARDELVRRFQDEPRGPRVFVLSLKAGGTGLNLTAANHVFHFDRWWNPAVEDQATDRAYRIGQTRSVQAHKLVCAGTLEERIEAMLERKRGLASKIVGSGESWITELDSGQLRELVALSTDVGGYDDEEATA